MYKERKETKHVEVGEEKHTSSSYIYIYIYIKDKHNVCKHGHKADVQEEGGKLSPLQRHVFLPLCRILKRNHIKIFLPLFVMIDKGYKKLESFTQET